MPDPSTYHWIEFLPASMQQMRAITLRLTVDVNIETGFQQGKSEVAHRWGQLCLHLFHVKFTSVIDNFVFVENTIHIALQNRIIVSFAIAEFTNRLCNIYSQVSVFRSVFVTLTIVRTFRDTSFLPTNSHVRLQLLEEIPWWPLKIY